MSFGWGIETINIQSYYWEVYDISIDFLIY
jgi:hypothetical protein